jgi:DNA-binding MarR family transcriptional regulator
MKDAQVTEFRGQMKMLARRLRSERPPAPGLTRTLVQVLATIRRLTNAPTPSQVAETLQMTSSNVAAALRELEAIGLIRRERDPVDARRVLLFPTERGAAVVADLRNERSTWLGKAIEAVLTADEQQALIEAGRLLQRVAEYEPTAVLTTAL